MSGTVIDDRYRIGEPLGAGGMGTVYRGERVKLGRVVAIKFLQRDHAAEEDFVKRFEREALALGRLYHPHCIGLIDFGVFDGRPYLVMDYVPGKTLEALLREGPLAPARAIRIMRQLLKTLDYFHGRNVVHRDLKAANVMLVDSEDETDFVKLLDFGMAKLLGGVGANLDVSVKGTVVGTPSAMSPEQIRELPIDGRSDIYSAGILLYHMVVGRKPFVHSDIVEVLKMHLEREPEAPRKIVGDRQLSEALERCILKALAKDREERFQSAAEMAEALERVPEAARHTPEVLPEAPAAGRSRSLVWVALAGWFSFAVLAAAVVTIVVAFPGVLDRLRGEGPAPQRAPVTSRDTSAVDAAPASDGVVLTASPVSLDASIALDAGAPAVATVSDAGFTHTKPAPDGEAWGPRKKRATALIAAKKHGPALREIQSLLREHPQAASDPEVIRAAIETLADPRGDQYIGYLARTVGRQPVAIDLLSRAVAGGATWYVRHHSWWLLERVGKADRGDRVAMWLADLRDADACPRIRAAYHKLSKSPDPRAQKIVAEVQAAPATDRRRRCLPRKP